jgi:hypothetical protein
MRCSPATQPLFPPKALAIEQIDGLHRLHRVRSCLEQPFQLSYISTASFQAILCSHGCLSDQKLYVALFVRVHRLRMSQDSLTS